jgi:phosphatidyl-myo-inositol dimannoside synthase
MTDGRGNAMTRVLLITNDFPPTVGGIARWYERICATVPPDCVIVLAPRLRGDVGFDARQPYKVIRRWVPVSRHPLARLIQMTILCAHAARMLRRERIRVVHIGQLHLGPIALGLKLFLKVPYVIYLHGGEMAPYMRIRAVRALARTIVRNARIVVVNSRYTLRHFQALGMHHPRVEVLTMGVETERFRPDLDTQHIRAAYGLNGQKVILTVARLDAYKGHDMVIRALKRVHQSVGSIRYLIAGSGQEERTLRALASNLECSEEVIFIGHVPENELPALYAACDVFIMPSRPLPQGDFEGFGIVFLEAGACGKPVVGGRSGGVPEAVIDGITGVLVEPTDAGEISDVLTRLLLDKEKAARLGMGGRRRTQQLESAWEITIMRIWSD